ncbi:hypothetical protein MPSEU_000330500 [Mayamaea pseudoterrestris]|nr:hypothetical protein MPSEU_000330500 [Mayamaea pseudoterrestris]
MSPAERLHEFISRVSNLPPMQNLQYTHRFIRVEFLVECLDVWATRNQRRRLRARRLMYDNILHGAPELQDRLDSILHIVDDLQTTFRWEKILEDLLTMISVDDAHKDIANDAPVDNGGTASNDEINAGVDALSDGGDDMGVSPLATDEAPSGDMMATDDVDDVDDNDGGRLLIDDSSANSPQDDLPDDGEPAAIQCVPCPLVGQADDIDDQLFSHDAADQVVSDHDSTENGTLPAGLQVKPPTLDATMRQREVVSYQEQCSTALGSSRSTSLEFKICHFTIELEDDGLKNDLTMDWSYTEVLQVFGPLHVDPRLGLQSCSGAGRRV